MSCACLARAWQAAMAWALDLSLAGWSACYGAFALAWSSLQYADHAFSSLDRIEGAWNLSVGGFTRRMFLNYHCHLEHHRDRDCPWQGLPLRMQAERDPPRRFLSVLLLMWQGPRLLPGSGQGSARQRLLDGWVIAAHILVFGAVFQLVYGLSSLDFVSRQALFDLALPIDARAPFVPGAALIYLSITPLLLVTGLVLGEPCRAGRVLGARVF